jgi:hypothetical protein
MKASQHPGQNGNGELQARWLAVASVGQYGAERLAIEKLHDDDGHVALQKHLVDLNHVAVIHASRQAPFVQEHLRGSGVLRELIVNDLENDELAEAGAFGERDRERGGASVANG